MEERVINWPRLRLVLVSSITLTHAGHLREADVPKQTPQLSLPKDRKIFSQRLPRVIVKKCSGRDDPLIGSGLARPIDFANRVSCLSRSPPTATLLPLLHSCPAPAKISRRRRRHATPSSDRSGSSRDPACTCPRHAPVALTGSRVLKT